MNILKAKEKMMKFREVPSKVIRTNQCLRGKKNNVVFEIYSTKRAIYIIVEHKKLDITYNSLWDNFYFKDVERAKAFCESFDPKKIQCKGSDAPEAEKVGMKRVGTVPKKTLKIVANKKRYDPSDKMVAIAIAARESIKYKINYYVVCTTNGYEITRDINEIPGNPQILILDETKIYQAELNNLPRQNRLSSDNLVLYGMSN